MKDISGCEIMVHGKGDKQRTVYMDETLCNMLRMYIATRETDSDYLFYGTRGETGDEGRLSGVSINSRIKAAGKRSGISEEKLSGLHAHTLRITALTNVIAKYGINIAMLLAGHSSVSITQIYNNTGNEEVKNALLNIRNAQ